MKILHTVEFYEPSVGGAQEVIKQISLQLVKRGHDVTVATTATTSRRYATGNGVRVEEFAVSGNEVRGFHGDTKRYQEFLLHDSFDVMMNYAAQQWASDLAFSILPRIPYHKVLSPCGFSGLFNPAYGDYFLALPQILKRYHHLIFHSYSYRDIEFAKQHSLTPCSVIPNGAAKYEFDVVDSTFRSRYGIPADIPLLLTVGTHSGIKGHELLIEAFRKARLGPAVLVMVGNPQQGGCSKSCHLRAARVKVFSLGQRWVLLLDPLREDVVAAFHAADLFVLGSNFECSPIVLFEAMASKTPFVTVECGNAAEVVSWSGGGVVVPTDKLVNGFVRGRLDELVQAIERLMNEPDERMRMAKAGHRAWQERFTWEKLAVEYEKLYESTIETTAAKVS